jgi:hypothetical protein
MEVLIERMLGDFENGRLSRRQLAVLLVALATGAAAATKAEAEPGLKAVSLNHVTVKVPDLQPVRSNLAAHLGGVPALDAEVQRSGRLRGAGQWAQIYRPCRGVTRVDEPSTLIASGILTTSGLRYSPEAIGLPGPAAPRARRCVG